MRASPDEQARAAALSDRLLAGALGDGRALDRPVPAPRDVPAEPWLGAVLVSVEERFSAFALAEAQGLLDEAGARLDRDGAASATRAELIELFLWRARVAEALDDEVGAAEAARQALAIDAALSVDPTRHPPTLAARIDAARGAATRCPFPLAISPPDARIAIDGAPAGPAPTEVGCGRHWVRVDAEGHEPIARAVLADAALPVEPVALAVAPWRALALPSAPGAPRPPLWGTAARALGRELLVLDVERRDDALVVTLGELHVDAPLDATPDDLVALLRAARVPVSGELDVGLVVGVSVGAAAVVAVAITLAVVLTAPAPEGFVLRGEIVP